MTATEINEWIEWLPIQESTGQHSFVRRCKDDVERVEVIKDLLFCAAADKMTTEDREICVKALEMLHNGLQTRNHQEAC